MAVIWHTTNFPGVRFYEHDSRKSRNGQPDKYFTIRYQVNGARKEEGIGWSTEGWSAESAYGVLSELKKAAKTGSGPRRLAEKRKADEEDRQRKRAEQEKEDREFLVRTLTLGTFFENYYLPRAKQEKRTWKDDVSRFNTHLRPSLGNVPISEIKPDHIQDILDSLRNKIAPATIKQVMAVIRRLYNTATDTRIDGIQVFTGKNPATGLRTQPIRNARERFLSADEVDALIAESLKVKNFDVHDAIIISVNTGLRAGEIVRLVWRDVDFIHGFITVRDEDNRKPGGTVPLNDEARAALEARKKRQKRGTAAVFPSRTGTRHSTAIAHEFKEIADSIGINDGIGHGDRKNRVVFHTLRHTFASWLALKGTDIYRIQKLMRHKTITMTTRYAHLIPDATREAVHNLRPPKKKQ